MRIILLARDIYESNPNGGSFFYRKLIENNRNDKFFYGAQKSNNINDRSRPSNATPIKSTNLDDFLHKLTKTDGHYFNLIDIPSWYFEDNELSLALKQNNIIYEKIIIGLHGFSSEIEKYSNVSMVNKKRLKEISDGEDKLLAMANYIYFLGDTRKVKRSIIKQRGIQIKMFKSEKTPFREKKIMNKPKIIGFAGRPDGTKGLDYLLKYVIREHSLNIHYNLAISSSARASEYIFNNNFLNHECTICKIQFNLNKKEMEEFYNSIDFYFSPSRYDSYNLTVLESFLKGIPILASNKTGSVKSLVKETRNVDRITLFRSNNYRSFRKKANRLIEDKSNSGFLKLTRKLRLNIDYNLNKIAKIDTLFDNMKT